MLSEEILWEINFKERSLFRHLKGKKDYRNWKLGLIELGLVRRPRQGRKTDLYIYSRTKEGRKVFEELKTLCLDI